MVGTATKYEAKTLLLLTKFISKSVVWIHSSLFYISNNIIKSPFPFPFFSITTSIFLKTHLQGNNHSLFLMFYHFILFSFLPMYSLSFHPSNLFYKANLFIRICYSHLHSKLPYKSIHHHCISYTTQKLSLF